VFWRLCTVLFSCVSFVCSLDSGELDLEWSVGVLLCSALGVDLPTYGCCYCALFVLLSGVSVLHHTDVVCWSWTLILTDLGLVSRFFEILAGGVI
jgi:hypothetical protein